MNPRLHDGSFVLVRGQISASLGSVRCLSRAPLVQPRKPGETHVKVAQAQRREGLG